MTTLSDSIAARIRELRLAKGWSQEQLAEEVNLSRDAISRIERGERSPRLETLAVIAKAVGIPLAKLLDFGEPPPKHRPSDERMRSLERAFDQLEPWLADAVMTAIRVITQAQVRAKSRRKRRTIQGRRKPPMRKSATHQPRRG
jgi:transcriptional regulator with XRE-family HTH domain